MTCSLGHDPEPLYVGVDDHQPHEEHREVEEGVGPGADQANQEGSKMAKNGLNGLYSIKNFSGIISGLPNFNIDFFSFYSEVKHGFVTGVLMQFVSFRSFNKRDRSF